MARLFAGRDATAPTRPVVRPERTDAEVREFLRLLPRYRVLLHRDEIHSFEQVIAALLQAIPVLSPAESERIAMESHASGWAEVIICLKEQAEHYWSELRRLALVSTVEPA
jgi:ATP-dependent Clp protease adaptor protein ClpS